MFAIVVVSVLLFVANSYADDVEFALEYQLGVVGNAAGTNFTITGKGFVFVLHRSQHSIYQYFLIDQLKSLQQKSLLKVIDHQSIIL
jgi:predicted N-acyltransferase